VQGVDPFQNEKEAERGEVGNVEAPASQKEWENERKMIEKESDWKYHGAARDEHPWRRGRTKEMEVPLGCSGRTMFRREKCRVSPGIQNDWYFHETQ
jgi:hypothetical protein